MSERMSKEQAQDLLVKMEAALCEVGADSDYALYVDICQDPNCNCGYDVWWMAGLEWSDEWLTTLWRAYHTAGAPDMMCLACWVHQFKTQAGLIDDCLSSRPFDLDCGVERG